MGVVYIGRKTMQRLLKKQGMEFKMSTKVTGASPSASGGIEVSTESVKDGKSDSLDCNVLLVSIGRRPYTHNLGLEVSLRGCSLPLPVPSSIA